MRTMMQMIADLAPLGRAVCSRDYDRAAKYFREVLPFKTISLDCSREHNGWVVPPSWDVEEAKIVKDGRVVYDGREHPLGVIALSRSFSGSVEWDELRRHLHYDHRFDDAIPFHYRQQFRSWSRDWGFCLPKRTFDAMTPGQYEVSIRTRESPGRLKILEYKHKGALKFTIALGSNLDHAGAANDGLAGCVVGVELMRRLQGRKTKFTYALILSPGIIGSEYYLASLTKKQRECIIEGVFLEMLGSETSLAVQESRQTLVNTSHALKASLTKLGLPFRTGPFESIIVNDEYVWENYGIPMPSFSRFPYPEYHSSKDSIAIIRESALQEAVEALLGAVEILEASPLIVKRFEGNVCLSHPRYDLYMDCGQIALGDSPTDQRRRWRQVMDLVPALDRPFGVRAVADHVGLGEKETLDYFKRWAAKRLVDLF